MHEVFLRRCMELAERGRGNVSPNPLVGCVIVQGGATVAEGWHERFGALHAERMAIAAAGAEATGSTLYVNLEPCCKAGKQPPCTEAIIAAGIREVVFGARDPSNPGAEELRRRGLRVTGPLLEAECRRQNRGFFSLKEKGRPWVTVKKAMTRDGRVTNPRGETRLKITSEEQDRWSHARLRAMHDAILVGSGTIVADNPKLNVRFHGACHPERRRRMTRMSWFDGACPERDRRAHHDTPSAPLSPRRIILDPHGEVPADATVLMDEDAARTLVIREKLPIRELLARLKEEGIASLLVEGGPRVWRAFEESGCIDEMVTLVGTEGSS